MTSMLLHNKIWFLVSVIALAGLAIGSGSWKWNNHDFPQRVFIHGKTYSIETADTAEKRTVGLGGRESLCESCGMLFVFPEKGTYSFWMKGMRFPLDIIWLSDDKIVSVKCNVPAESQEVFTPKEEADGVLELNAGECGDLKEGERIRFEYEKMN